MMKQETFAIEGEFIICAITDENRDDYVNLHRQSNGYCVT